MLSEPSAAVRSPHFEPLTPTAYLDRSAYVFVDKVAVVSGENRYTYGELRARCTRFAGGLANLGVQPGDRVAVLAPNTSLLLEAHYSVPYAGAVLVALNTRLSVAELAYIVEHSGAKVLLHHHEFTGIAAEIGATAKSTIRLIDGGDEYEQIIKEADPLVVPVSDEKSLICINYTSGTTGRPKGVMYHHRGAYLQAMAMKTHFGLTSDASYLWTLPMFHCNGWCFTWAVTAAGGTHVCLPQVDPAGVWAQIENESITHLCAAPTVLTSMVTHSSAHRIEGRELVVAVGGAPPTPSLLERCAELGLAVTHLYGLTETFGPVVICDWRSEWSSLSKGEQAVHRARQGVGNTISCIARVVDGAGGDVVADGAVVGEIAIRGNNLMLGYYRDDAATAVAVPDGWFRTGDLAVLHPDGYIEIRDRKKDVIISGGENISSVEVEAVIASHPAVLEAAVVAVPHERWGERPVAWVTVRDGFAISSEELREHVRQRLARFKVPDRVYFGVLPKTATGKVQKFRVRELIKETAADSHHNKGGT